MPIYEYQCTICEHRLEALQKISDTPLQQCPACNKPGLKKLVSAASFRLKGGGWYETDFKTGAKKQLAESDSAAKSSSSTQSADKGSTPKSDSSKAKTESKSSKAKNTKASSN